jgi:hypothetical protein
MLDHTSHHNSSQHLRSVLRFRAEWSAPAEGGDRGALPRPGPNSGRVIHLKQY